MNGSSGTSGTSGDGAGGTGGSGAAGGTGGAAGTGGVAGTGGSGALGGSGGTGGAAGTSGSGGVAGSAGSSGGAGTSGSAGSVIGLSCAGLAANCGATQDDDCCSTATTIPGAEVFYREADAHDMFDTSHPQTVSSFRLDKYEVTVGRFRTFVNAYDAWRAQHPVAGEGGDPHVSGSSWKDSWTSFLPASSAEFQDSTHLSKNPTHGTWTAVTGPDETKAINCVSWYEAVAFCTWDGGWLPTQNELQYAACGGAQRRVYPWSSPPADETIDTTYANYETDTFPSDGAVEPVGSHPAGHGRWGHQDLSGNVIEWGWDWFNSGYMGTANVTCWNCVNMSPNTSPGFVGRSIRGGNWSDNAASLKTVLQAGTAAENHDYRTGFRCAHSP